MVRFCAGARHPAVLCAVLCLGLSGCASLPEDVDRDASSAIDDYASTTLGQLFAPDERRHPGLSGFAVVSDSINAFRARIAMIRLAEKSIDLQYYIWDADMSGGLMALELLDAANRGVRIRALIDDSTQTGRDNALLAYDAHPNIEVRVFNPFAHRGSRAVGYLTDFTRLNHRMHNKMIAADNAVALIGGRNIADHYFGVHEESNFRDLDIGAVGPVVRKISTSFDVFWNSEWAYPVAAIVKRDERPTLADLQAQAEAVRARLAEQPYPLSLEEGVEEVTGGVSALPSRFTWARGRILVDDPDELTERGSATGVITALRDQMDSMNEELLIEAAYFVPLERGVERLRQLTSRGVRVRILTNSLASNDVAAAHSGYEEFREDLLEAGVELYELRPDSDEIIRGWSVVAGESRSLLHTKALVWDRDTLFIGSLNLDPRSTDINTELGLLVESEALARQVAAYMDQGASLNNAYRVQLDADGDLVWSTRMDNGELVQFDKEPQTGVLKRGTADFIKALPVESQL
jgi:putative cardiolipin synthase